MLSDDAFLWQRATVAAAGRTKGRGKQAGSVTVGDFFLLHTFDFNENSYGVKNTEGQWCAAAAKKKQ